MTSKEYSRENRKAVIICGPTASGKSTLGIAVCGKFKGSIIGADTRQVYRRLDIGTDKPSPEDRKKIPHYLVDIVDIDENFTAAEFARRASDGLEQIREAGRIPVIVGGAGLYLEALTAGLAEAPPGDIKIRMALEKRIEREGSARLHDELAVIDPETAGRISPNDPARIMRALEIYELSGRPACLFRQEGRSRKPDFDFMWIGLELPREVLYDRIDARVDRMIESGLMEEVKELVEDGFGEALKRKKIVGYSEILDTLEGKYQLDEAVRLIKQHSRNYAKRQLTWFRNRSAPAWINPLEKGFEGKVFGLIDDYLKRT
jgi:tRNA dimethylallyltransferase